MARRPEHLSQKEAAKRLGISVTMLRKLGDRVSRNADGTYPWPKIHQEHASVVVASKERKAEGYGNESYQAERARLTRLKAEAAELELRRKRREVIELVDVDRLVRKQLERVNATLEQVPERYAEQLAKKASIKKRDARRILESIVELVRADLRVAPGAAA